MATSDPLRLDAELVRSARAAARLYKRSLPRQIEYWAEIGRALEKEISAEDLLALREGLARVAVDRIVSVPVEPDEVHGALEASRSEGSLADRVCESAVRYQSSPAPGAPRADRSRRKTHSRQVPGRRARSDHAAMTRQNQLWVLAGGNGSGKSTFHRLFLEPRGLMMVNADELARALRPTAPEEASYDVPEEKVRSRLPRAFANFRAALPLIDEALVIDNSSADDPFRVAGRIAGGVVHVDRSRAPAWVVDLLGG